MISKLKIKKIITPIFFNVYNASVILDLKLPSLFFKTSLSRPMQPSHSCIYLEKHCFIKTNAPKISFSSFSYYRGRE